MIHVQRTFEISERRACKAIGQPRSTQRYVGQRASDDQALSYRMSDLSRQNPRYGFTGGCGLCCVGKVGR